MSAASARLSGVRLYLISDASPPGGLIRLLEAAVRGGVDMFQLREKNFADSALLEAAASCARTCSRLGVPFIVNDRADIALAAHADGVHLGQDDLPVGAARALLGPAAIIGLSTHSREQIDAAGRDVDYIGVGPIHETPTKPGRPAVGLDLLRYAAAHAAQPFFAIGGLDPGNLAEAVRAGAQRISILRWIAQAPDPEAAARDVRDAMDHATAGASCERATT
ncbi:MAG TPA: thiamine phosphate synthase [Candidatus Eremiobacteraceae bacterium]|nr:thiamine phosphate synthase [Candidatus Eremiobacteraceae bacterium]